MTLILYFRFIIDRKLGWIIKYVYKGSTLWKNISRKYDSLNFLYFYTPNLDLKNTVLFSTYIFFNFNIRFFIRFFLSFAIWKWRPLKNVSILKNNFILLRIVFVNKRKFFPDSQLRKIFTQWCPLKYNQLKYVVIICIVGVVKNMPNKS